MRTWLAVMLIAGCHHSKLDPCPGHAASSMEADSDCNCPVADELLAFDGQACSHPGLSCSATSGGGCGVEYHDTCICENGTWRCLGEPSEPDLSVPRSD